VKADMTTSEIDKKGLNGRHSENNVARSTTILQPQSQSCRRMKAA
jgi:hypothetical protein